MTRRTVVTGAAVVAALGFSPKLGETPPCPFPRGSREYHDWWRERALLSFGSDYLRAEATKLRQMAEMRTDAACREGFLWTAANYDELAERAPTAAPAWRLS
ncbi:hypothetical protein ACE7GA_01410 [Roseomonas sp. CCTCC AB2023176]|uniref:hypothetical protein n=1 Tax=Roseomonas sp. CCTCC AB2023176 TaxID=3342640 RepID=UPI0035D694DF